MQTLQVLQSEKELQSGGEVKELADAADKLSKRLVKDTTAWTNKKENLDTDQATCQQACPYVPAACLDSQQSTLRLYASG